jgi:hypothetical protein
VPADGLDTLAWADVAAKLLDPVELQEDRSRLSLEPYLGLSDEQSESISAFAAEVQAGIDAASPGERRRIYELLGLRGTVSCGGDDGVCLSRIRHRFRVDWESLLTIRHRDREFVNVKTVFLSAGSGLAVPAQKVAE